MAHTIMDKLYNLNLCLLIDSRYNSNMCVFSIKGNKEWTALGI